MEQTSTNPIRTWTYSKSYAFEPRSPKLESIGHTRRQTGGRSLRMKEEEINLAHYFWDEYITSEQRLLVGIFTVALKDYLCPEQCLARHHRRSARYYFETLRPNEYGSFGHFCLYLDLEPERVRELVLTDIMKGRLRDMGIVMGREKRGKKGRKEHPVDQD